MVNSRPFRLCTKFHERLQISVLRFPLPLSCIRINGVYDGAGWVRLGLFGSVVVSMDKLERDSPLMNWNDIPP